MGLFRCYEDDNRWEYNEAGHQLVHQVGQRHMGLNDFKIISKVLYGNVINGIKDDAKFDYNNDQENNTKLDDHNDNDDVYNDTMPITETEF